MDIPIVYQDEWLLVINKPAGILTVPAEKNKNQDITSLLNEKISEAQAHLHPCHRLDKETSGLVIFAKGKSNQQKVMELFHAKKIKKTYVAFVQGTFNQAKGEIKQKIEGEPAQTRFQVTEQRKGFAVVEVEPLTGRTNQIRIHFKSIGHPLLGEKKFAFRRDFEIKANRLCLHASHLEFTHPFTGKIISLDTDLPTGMKNFLVKYPK